MSSDPEVAVLRNLVVLFPVMLAVQIWPTAAEPQSFYVGGRLGLVGGAVWFEDKEANDIKQPMPGLQIGVQRGWTETEAGGGRRLAYAELPLLVAMTAPWKTAPQLLVGGAVGFEVACSVTGVDVGTVSCDDARVEWHRAKTQFGTWFGIGLRRRLGRGQLDLQLLGNLNLTSVNSETLPRGYARLFGVAVSAVYMIPLGGR
jgi:hypothetical protein